MTRKGLIAAALVVGFGVASAAEAQINIVRGGGKRSISIGPGGVHFWSPRPSRPVYVGPKEVVGYNPWTGAVHTHNTQINDTAFDYGREESRYNGTRRWVNRPVHDQWGNLIGHKQGYVWRNSYTGQEHAELTFVRLNSTGGTDSTTVIRSMPSEKSVAGKKPAARRPVSRKPATREPVTLRRRAINTR